VGPCSPVGPSYDGRVEPKAFVEGHRELYHLAADGSWPQFHTINALLSTRRTLDLFDLTPEVRTRIERQPRARSFKLTHPKFGAFVIRDQAVLQESKLEPVLTDMTVEEWCFALNGRVYLWPSDARLNQLLAAKLYRDSWHLVLVLSTEKLLSQHLADVRLSRINGGATLYEAAPRGSGTYAPLATHAGPVAEVAVELAIAPLLPLMLRAERRRSGAPTTTIWTPP
jgi:hypothetical protein